MCVNMCEGWLQNCLGTWLEWGLHNYTQNATNIHYAVCMLNSVTVSRDT